MTGLKKKFIVILILNMSLLMWALITMIKSLNTGENWRIVFSIIGFVGFLALTSLFVYAIIKKMKEEKIE